MVSLLVTINTFLYECFEKAKKYPYIWICFVILLAAISLIWLPHWRVSYFGINNATENATLENQYRATIAQILGGIAIGISLYYTWRRITIAEEDLKATKEGQITERFTRAVDQLGNRKMEIRLGGIYALERIANESEKDYWPIIEILTAYVRMNSNIDSLLTRNMSTIELTSMDIQASEFTKKEAPEVKQLSLDIQAVLTVLGKRKNAYSNEESEHLNLSKTFLNRLTLIGAYFEETDFKGSYLQRALLKEVCFKNADFSSAHLEGTELRGCNLEGANFENGHFEGAYITKSNLKKIFSRNAHFEKVHFIRSNLERAYLPRANLKEALLLHANFEGADLEGADLEGANFGGVNLNGAYLEGANLEGARNLSIDQLSKAKTLYNAKLDDELLIPLKEKYPALFDKPKQ